MNESSATKPGAQPLHQPAVQPAKMPDAAPSKDAVKKTPDLDASGACAQKRAI